MGKDSLKYQLYEACQCKRTPAQLLDYLLAIYRIKQNRSPKAKPGDRELWMDFTQEQLATAIMCSRHSVARAMSYLLSLNFITVHKPKGFGRTLWYQLNELEINKHIQVFELAGTEDVHCSKAQQCIVATCDNALSQSATMQSSKLQHCISPPSPSSIPSSSHPGNDDDENENDPEREHLVKTLGTWNVQKERVEHWLTNYTRQLIHLGISYTTLEMRRKSIQNPAGVLYRFLENPFSHGYELRHNGTWGLRREQPKSQYEDYTKKRIEADKGGALCS